MDTHRLLQVASEIIEKVPSCMAITVDQNGDANARVVNPKPLSDGWTVRFATHRRSRKSQEIEQSGRMTLAYQYDPDNAYVTLIGRAVINDDVATKTANWRPESHRWHPGGPADPNVVYIDFTTERIELWSSAHAVVPDPKVGLWAAVLVREASGWRLRTTLPHLDLVHDNVRCRAHGAHAGDGSRLRAVAGGKFPKGFSETRAVPTGT